MAATPLHPLLKGLAMVKERMRPVGDFLWLRSFASTFLHDTAGSMIGRGSGMQNTCATFLKRLSSGTSGGRNLRGSG